MLDALERCGDLFARYGGHRQAAGLSMDAARVPEFRARINAHADTVLAPEDLRPRLRIDARLPLSGIAPAVVDTLERMAPFGLGNPRPVFDAPGVEIVSGPTKLKERHLTMTVRQDGHVFRALAWRSAERFDFLQAHRARLDLAYHVERNTFREATRVELTVADVRAAE
jgi:single-stranded-DNA-specific exonuclease